MLVDATYNEGRLQFEVPLQFARTFFKIKVDIPDQEIVLPKTVSPHHTSSQMSSTLTQRVNEIVGEPFRRNNTGKPSINCKEIWHAYLEEKHLGC